MKLQCIELIQQRWSITKVSFSNGIGTARTECIMYAIQRVVYAYRISLALSEHFRPATVFIMSWQWDLIVPEFVQSEFNLESLAKDIY